MTDLVNRRPLKTRGAAWASALARRLAAAEVNPDLLSACSVVLAMFGGALLCMAGLSAGVGRSLLLLAAAGCIQGRLLANMLDGMVAVEHGKGSAYGPIWNELPDRIADVLFLVAAGYAALAAGRVVGPSLGWLCAVLAVLTAYVRELGRGLGRPADFSGPMAKPHRMAALTVACVISAFEGLWRWNGQAMLIALGLIALGSVVTVARRTRNLARGLAAQGAPQ